MAHELGRSEGVDRNEDETHPRNPQAGGVKAALLRENTRVE